MNPALHLASAARLALTLALSTLAGCATFSPDGGFAPVQDIARERLGQPLRPVRSEADARQVADEVQALLAAPLDADAAVRIALLNNPGLQADYAELGIAEADLVQAGRLRNPGFTFARYEQGTAREYERTFLFDLMGLLTLPARQEIESRRFRQTQLRVAERALGLAADTRQAWIAAVAAREAGSYLEQAAEASAASAELARRMAEAGNFSQLRAQREQLFHAEVAAQLARARNAATSEQERLVRLLGLEDASRLTLAERLPDLPEAPLPGAALEQQAMDQRLDLAMAREEIAGLAKSLGLTRATRFVNVLEVGWLNANTTGEPVKRGYEIELRLPLFDWGDAHAKQAEARYTQALRRAGELGVNARSQVRAAHAAYRAAYDLARHYRDQVVPLRKRIAEENLLRYNGMLISVFELLADAREQVASVNAAIQASKDFWLAESQLQMSLNGGAGEARPLAGGMVVGGTDGGGGGH